MNLTKKEIKMKGRLIIAIINRIEAIYPTIPQTNAKIIKRGIVKKNKGNKRELDHNSLRYFLVFSFILFNLLFDFLL